jgi:hypothetical protein
MSTFSRAVFLMVSLAEDTTGNIFPNFFHISQLFSYFPIIFIFPNYFHISQLFSYFWDNRTVSGDNAIVPATAPNS